MADETQTTVFEFELGDYGDKLKFTSPDELRDWNEREFSSWQWIENARPSSQAVWAEHNNFRNQVENYVSEWRRYPKNPEQVQSVFRNLESLFDHFYCKRRIFNSTAPEVEFINKLGAERGDAAAAGAYACLLNAPIRLESPMMPDFVFGLFQGFLYQREIDWTASAHQEVLNRLRKQYEENTSQQESRFKEVESRNALLNTSFAETLNAKRSEMEKLLSEQAAEFRKQVDTHGAKLTAIERTYDQKLALQKPVKYWQTKERYHRIRSNVFGIGGLLLALLSFGGLGWLAYQVLHDLKPTDNPKHWHIGVLVVGVFFAVWLVRVFVRLFFSHVHLATDAAERRMMILTYLAMSREGTSFPTEDKKLIVQHIFRSASDGLVKDDAAPPSLFEMLSRK